MRMADSPLRTHLLYVAGLEARESGVDKGWLHISMEMVHRSLRCPPGQTSADESNVP